MADICEVCGYSIGRSEVVNQIPELGLDCVCYDCAEPLRQALRIADAQNLDELPKIVASLSARAVDGEDLQRLRYVSALVDKLSGDSAPLKEQRADVVLTTGPGLAGYTITQYVGVIAAETVLGTGFLSEFSASFADLRGKESSAFGAKFSAARQSATDKLRAKAVSVDANAVICLDYDYLTIGDNMIVVIANGTAVKASKNEAPR